MLTALSKLLGRSQPLAEPTSAEDFTSLVTDLERHLRAAIEGRDTLSGDLQSALFGAAGDVTKVRRRIVEADRNIEELTLALQGARERYTAAAKAETTQALERRAVQAREADKRLRAALKKWHGLAAPLAQTAHQIYTCEQAIKQTNRAMLDAGRRDLMVPSYLNDLAGKRREIADRRRAKQGRPPTNPAQPITAVTPIARLHLPYYFERPGGSATDPVLCPPEDSPYKDF